MNLSPERRAAISAKTKANGRMPPGSYPNPDRLTPLQQRFVLEYIRDLNAFAAARRAGYTCKRNAASTMLRTPKIAAAIQLQLDAKAEAAKLDAVGVLRHAVEMLRADTNDIMDEKGNYKPMSEWPVIWRQMLSACEVETHRNLKGEEVGRVTRVRFADRVKVLELIGRHINVRAFVTQHEVGGVGGGPVRIDVTRMPTDQLEQMRQWLVEAAAMAKSLPAHMADIEVQPNGTQ